MRNYTRLVRGLLTVVLVAVSAVAAKPAVETVFATYQMAEGQRKLPIYSVDVPDKKIAISFDAAWAASI